ncbi:MAG: M20/M25/M40 family metallo-hydrolase [Anaerolineales bacterium]|nr:M20/M25/M40 family metallo-hydrolase [Anaerolineales bacterium]
MEIKKEIFENILELASSLQQIPSPTFLESERTLYLQKVFNQEGLKDVIIDDVGNLYGRLPGRKESNPLIVSAHLDTVFSEDTDLHLEVLLDKIKGPSIGDNSIGLAGLLALVWSLKEQKITLPGDLWLVANVCEEGLGNLRGMRAVVEKFGQQPIAYLILEGMALGRIYHRGLGVERWRIKVSTQGGHSWTHYGRPSAIHELAKFIADLSALRLPRNPRTSLNVGIVHGGVSINTIAPEAYLEIDLRSESDEKLRWLSQRVRDIVDKYHKLDVQFDLTRIGQRPVGEIPATHPLVLLARRAIQEQGLNPVLSIASTDANIPLSKGLPAICIGLTTGAGAHTTQEYINISPLKNGLAQLVTLVRSAFEEL